MTSIKEEKKISMHEKFRESNKQEKAAYNGCHGYYITQRQFLTIRQSWLTWSEQTSPLFFSYGSFAHRLLNDVFVYTQTAVNKSERNISKRPESPSGPVAKLRGVPKWLRLALRPVHQPARLCMTHSSCYVCIGNSKIIILFICRQARNPCVLAA